MAVQENLMAAGSWGLKLRKDTPQRILDKVGFFSHVAITRAPEDVRLAGDALLDSARYVGLLRGKVASEEGTELSGAGLAVWIGDEDDKGAVLETARTYTGATFTSVVTDLLADTSLRPGTLHSVTGTYSGTHQYQTPRKAITYVCSTMDAEWRVNPNFTLDAGQVDDLYPVEPRIGVFAKARGTSSRVKALPGKAKLATDVEDFTTRAVLLAQGSEASVATAAADIDPAKNPYKDRFGNPVKMTRLVSESETSQGNAQARAQLQLNRFTGTRDAVTLNSTTHDLAGDLTVGEWSWVYDPDAGLYDNNTELQWQGEVLHPVRLRLTSVTWPVAQGHGVYLRTGDGEWVDLTDFVTWESGQTNVTVGGYNRALVATGGEPVQTRTPTVQPNTSVPAAPVWTTPLRTAVYRSPVTGLDRAEVWLNWGQPLNTDGTAIIDGDHYEVRYRTTSQAILAATHQQMSLYSHEELGTHDSPIPFTTSGWAYLRAPWDSSEYLLSELQPGTPYEFQVRAVDNGTPANPSDWSASIIVQTALDNQPPETPAAPFVAGNKLGVQVVHRLGAASGGDFNLSSDLARLEVHAEYEPNYEPRLPTPRGDGTQDPGTLIGTIQATARELGGQIPVVRSFKVDNTTPVWIKVVAVDGSGNRSRPSVGVQASIELLDSAYITSLIADKIEAGQFKASYTLSGQFATSYEQGVRRSYMTGADGFFSYDEKDKLTFWAGGPDGYAYVRGQFTTGLSGERRISIVPDNQTLLFYPTSSVQRYVFKAYTVDEARDAADSPGMEIYGRNELDQREGAYISLWEDGYIIGMQAPAEGADVITNDPRYGGRIYGYRGGIWVGYEDNTPGNTEGFSFIAQPLGWWIQSRAPGQAGGYAQGGQSTTTLANRDGAGNSSRIVIDRPSNEIELYPTPGRGERLIAQHNSGNPGNSAKLLFFTPVGYGGAIKIWNNNEASNGNFEFRTWDDTGFVGVVASNVALSSDMAGKTDIAEAPAGALGKVRGTKAKRYRRRKGESGPAELVERDLDEPLVSRGDEQVGKNPLERMRRKLEKAQEKTARKAAAPAPALEDGPEELGLIAQEVQEVAPEIVHESGDGLTIDLYGMTTLNWQAIGELAEENDELRDRVSTLEEQVAALVKAVEKLTPKSGK